MNAGVFLAVASSFFRRREATAGIRLCLQARWCEDLTWGLKLVLQGFFGLEIFWWTFFRWKDFGKDYFFRVLCGGGDRIFFGLCSGGSRLGKQLGFICTSPTLTSIHLSTYPGGTD